MLSYTSTVLLQDIDEALHRLPQDVVDARMQRLKRAVDCSLKKSYLSKEIQDMQTPYSWYLKVNLAVHNMSHDPEGDTTTLTVVSIESRPCSYKDVTCPCDTWRSCARSTSGCCLFCAS